jgi:D-glycero-alpha-D-manno-heptose 1-phosphate guanylyltransferase
MHRSVDAVVLVGGRGTRLSSVVRDVPKPLAPVGSRPFLDHLLAVVTGTRCVRRVILAAGYMAEAVERYALALNLEVPVEVVAEIEPLGTGGAVRHAILEAGVSGEKVIVLNGDAIGRWPLDDLLASNLRRGDVGTLVAVDVADVSRYGRLSVCDDRVDAFAEKGGIGAGLVNGGVYCFDASLLASWQQSKFSIEFDVLTDLVKKRQLGWVRGVGPFIDIGVPESFAEGQTLVGAISGLS